MSAKVTSLRVDLPQPEPDGIAIPAQPKLLAEIARVFSKPEKVAALIAADPAVSEGVLEVINSPGIGLSKPVEKIEQAVMMLGLDSILNVVNAVLLHSTLQIESNPKLATFWKNAKATAAAAGILASEVTEVKPDDAYLLGLFRDCGIPLIVQKHPSYFSVLEQGYRDQTARIIEIEDKKFGVNHAVVSHLIARAWNLPVPIVQAIKEHHSHRRLMCEGRNQVEAYVDRLVATLKLAEHVSRASVAYGNTVKDQEWDIYKSSILKLINKPPQEILDVVNSIVATLQQTEEYL